MEITMSQTERALRDHLYDIAYINNLDSDNLVESLQMILDKGLEGELVHEIHLTANKCIAMLKNRMAFRNHCQRRYGKIVRHELADCQTNSLPL